MPVSTYLLKYTHIAHPPIHTCTYPLAAAPVTKSGDTMLGLAVREGQFGIIKYLVSECNFGLSGEHYYVSLQPL